jgi:hypothetical protein
MLRFGIIIYYFRKKNQVMKKKNIRDKEMLN